MKRILIILFVIASMSGCTIQQQLLNHESNVIPNNGKGVLLLSITEPQYRNKIDDRFYPILYFRKVGTKEIRVAKSMIYGTHNLHNLKKHKDKTDFANKLGTLLPIVLDEGEYEVFEAHVVVSILDHWWDNFEPLKFTIKSGKVTYIGNYEFYILKEPSGWGDGVRAQPERFEVLDSSDDIPLFLSRYPQFSEQNIEHQIGELVLINK